MTSPIGGRTSRSAGRRSPARLLVLCLLGGLLVVGVGLASGVLPVPRGQDAGRPPCEELPDRAAVAAAVEAHQPLVARIREAGPGVQVTVATPCAEHPDRGLVAIRYASSAERERVDAVLTREAGFGVPVQLVKS